MPFDPSKMSDAEIAEALRDHAPPDLSKMTDAELAEALKGHEAPPGWIEDIGKGAASGAVHGAIGNIVGLPGAIQQLGDAATRTMGGVPTPREARKVNYPTPDEVSKGIGKLTGYEEYDPKYAWGRVAKGATSNALPIIAGGIGAGAGPTSAMVSALRYGLVPAATGEGLASASEAYVGKDQGVQDAARLAGNLLSPGLRGVRTAAPALEAATGKDVAALLGSATAGLYGAMKHGEPGLLGGLWLGEKAGSVVGPAVKRMAENAPPWMLPNRFSWKADPLAIVNALAGAQRPQPENQ